MARFSSKWRSPSNIALVKYWGKYENQIPANPSISFTLSNCFSETEVKLSEKQTKEAFSLEVLLDGIAQESFKPKIIKFFNKISRDIPWLQDYHISINTHNSFPHSSGIASSASGMSALALCLIDIDGQINAHEPEDFYQKASTWSRLGSGSASRSVYGQLVEWGDFEGIEESSDLYAIPYKSKVHHSFQDFCDFILLVETGSKAVSSTAGHALMENHDYANARFKQAHKNMHRLLEILSSGDLHAFGKLVESEALTLHAMMMSSVPYFLLMKPNTLEIIEKIWEFRKRTELPLYFTLDAGANLHLLFPKEIESEVTGFVDSSIVQHLKDGRYIKDKVGSGPIKLSE